MRVRTCWKFQAARNLSSLFSSNRTSLLTINSECAFAIELASLEAKQALRDHLLDHLHVVLDEINFDNTNASDLDSAQSQPSSSTSPVALPTNTPIPAKSFKEVVASPTRSSDCTSFEKRLTEAELSLKEHKERLRELDRKAEVQDMDKRQLNLVVYNIPDIAEDEDGAETLSSLLSECMPDTFGNLEWDQLRLGTFRPDQERPRPVRMQFDSMSDKHIFLKHAKHLKEVNLRYDDDLTRLQQRQRKDMAADFDTLKSKGHKPFYRGSSLKFRHADKTRTCKRHAATRAPDAQV